MQDITFDFRYDGSDCRSTIIHLFQVDTINSPLYYKIFCICYPRISRDMIMYSSLADISIDVRDPDNINECE